MIISNVYSPNLFSDDIDISSASHSDNIYLDEEGQKKRQKLWNNTIGDRSGGEMTEEKSLRNKTK